MRGEEANQLRPVGGEGRASLIRVIRGEKCAECPGTKVEKEAALTRHYGYWKTIGFQGFVHSWLVVGRGVDAHVRNQNALLN